MLPVTMNAIEITQAGGPEVLKLTTRPVPQPAAGQVLIKVAYAGINRHDCGQRNRGFGPKGAIDIPGLEVSGDVVAVGAGVTRWKVGDKVCALTNGGGYAQYCLALQEVTFPIPDGFDMKMAAGLPEALMTAWLNVFMLGRLKAGEWLLVHGGSSGVGSAAINYRTQDFVAEVEKITAGHGADVILDMAGAAYAKRNLQAVAMDGRVIHISSGDTNEYSVPLGMIMGKRAIVSGSGLRVSALPVKVEIVRQLNEKVWAHLGAKVTPVIDSILPLARASDAHARMETSEHIGKILLDVSI